MSLFFEEGIGSQLINEASSIRLGWICDKQGLDRKEDKEIHRKIKDVIFTFCLVYFCHLSFTFVKVLLLLLTNCQCSMSVHAFFFYWFTYFGVFIFCIFCTSKKKELSIPKSLKTTSEFCPLAFTDNLRNSSLFFFFSNYPQA